MTRRNLLVYGLLAAVWVLIGVWQVEEHIRVREAAKTDLRNRSVAVAKTVSASIRSMRFRGGVPSERLESFLDELINGRSNELVKSSEILSVALLNASGETVAKAGRPIVMEQTDIQQEGEHWGRQSVTLVNPVDLGASLSSEGVTNTVLLPPRTNGPPEGFRGRGFQRRESGPPPEQPGVTNGPPPATNPEVAGATNSAAPGEREARSRGGDFRPPRPPRFWGISEKEYQELLQKRALHGVVLAMSTETFQAATIHDLWLRAIIMVMATISVLGSGVAWRNLSKTSELQIRLVRASELNTHLKEMNLAAAGLAHETRNPLNIIRGRAQMISKQPESTPEIRQRSREIIDEADKVAAQLNEFINYSRPRELRRTRLALGSVVGEVVRALSYDLEEKKIRLEVKGEQLSIEADEQLLRQALFNLLLNAIQAVESGGEIQVVAQRCGGLEAQLEVRDNGPGVSPENRAEIFKPYFTTQKTGTGLGLAVVQQIVLTHGWEIECLPNEPKGAVFRITHLKLATAIPSAAR
jgi:signal transduction histidine kinase